MIHSALSHGLAVSLLLAAPVASHAACSSTLPLSSTTVPTLPGRIVFQGADSSGNTQLYTFDFSNNTQAQISGSWGLTAPLNAQFSPDGKKIAFTAVQSNRRDDYIFTFGTSAPVNLTSGMTGATKSEDPKWSADGKKLIVKQDGNIKIFTLAFSGSGVPSVASVQVLTTNGVLGTSTEASQPYLSPDNKYAYFVRDIGANQRVRIMTIATLSESLFANNSNYSYYPIVRDFTTIFYTGWTSATGRNDQILLQVPNITGTTVLQPTFDDCNSDNSDAAPVDSDYVMFSSDNSTLSPSRAYRPVLASIVGGQVWDLSRVGVGSGIAGGILGLSYTAAR